MADKKNEFPKYEMIDVFGNHIERGSLVLYFPKVRKYKSDQKGGINIGIFIKENKDSYSIGLPMDNLGKEEAYLDRAIAVVLVKDPIHNLDISLVRKALDSISALKKQGYLPKKFDENVSWGF